MPQPDIREVHVDQLLTNVMIAYKQDATKFIADRVFPVVPVEKQSDKILRWTKEYWFKVQAGLRAPGTESRGGGFSLGEPATYFCDIHAFHVDVPIATLKNADIPNFEQQIIEFVTYQLLLEREVNWAKAYFDDTGKTPGTDFWTVWQGVAGEPGSGQFKQWDQSGSDPVADVLEAREYILSRTGFAPNIMIISPQVFHALRKNSAVQAQIVYAPSAAPDVKGLVTPELLAKLFEVEKVLVAETYVSTSPEGAASEDLSPIFGPHALLVYAPPKPGLLIPTGGYIFEWTGYNSGYSVAVSTIEMPHLKAIRYEGEMAYAMELLGPDLGIFFKDAVSTS